MIKNEISRVNTVDILELEKNAKKNECYIVNIQGGNIQTKKSFLELMTEKFYCLIVLGGIRLQTG
ncbi:hypothetical protein FE124_00935 [Listeria monocytogenes]|uniref:hypothetical protein n=1 Tax=Listeria monocytogenes TaxID=1639 RepID=UPI0015E68B9A|nr:hypothetical protein [Listeria monocytogenes]EAO7443151.1 hypothetical protein [Listeria monocytogenes]